MNIWTFELRTLEMSHQISSKHFWTCKLRLERVSMPQSHVPLNNRKVNSAVSIPTINSINLDVCTTMSNAHGQRLDDLKWNIKVNTMKPPVLLAANGKLMFYSRMIGVGFAWWWAGFAGFFEIFKFWHQLSFLGCAICVLTKPTFDKANATSFIITAMEELDLSVIGQGSNHEWFGRMVTATSPK